MKWLGVVICTFALLVAGSLPAAAGDRSDDKRWRGGSRIEQGGKHHYKSRGDRGHKEHYGHRGRQNHTWDRAHTKDHGRKRISNHRYSSFAKKSVHIHRHHRPGRYHGKVRHRIWEIRRDNDDALVGGLIGGALGAFLGNAVYAATESGTMPVGAGSDCKFESAGRYCREFISEARVAGRSEPIYGVACRQPDGSWEVVSMCAR